MAMRKGGRKVYRSYQGKQVDMDMLRKKHELTPAVGNVRVNARGDELGPGGKIIRKREDIVKDYYGNTSAVIDQDTTTATPATQPTTEPTAEELDEFEQMDEEWIEDADGNFVLKDK